MEVPPPISLCTPSSLPSHVDENRLQLWPFPTAVSPSPIHSGGQCELFCYFVWVHLGMKPVSKSSFLQRIPRGNGGQGPTSDPLVAAQPRGPTVVVHSPAPAIGVHSIALPTLPTHRMCEVAAILRRVTSPFPVSPRPLLTSVPSRMHFGTKPGDHVSCAFFFCSAWCFVSGRERPPPTVRLGLPSPQFCTPPSLCPLILSCLYLIWPDPHFFAPLASKRLRFKSFVMSSVPPTFPFALWIGVSCFTCQSALFFLSSP
jgi:hypothetical protein